MHGVPAERRQDDCPIADKGAQRASFRKIRSLLTGALRRSPDRDRDDRHGPGGRGRDPQGRHRRRSRRIRHRQLQAQRQQARHAGSQATAPRWSRSTAPTRRGRACATAAKGANVLIYLGHGNGWPSPYRPFADTSKDGFGLNASSGTGTRTPSTTARRTWRSSALAPHAVVVLNRLCYASGNNEWGAGNPTQSTAIKRVDNYGAGFLKAGAQAVFASGITNVVATCSRACSRASKPMTMSALFWTDPTRTVYVQVRRSTSNRTLRRQGADGPVQAASATTGR